MSHFWGIVFLPILILVNFAYSITHILQTDFYPIMIFNWNFAGISGSIGARSNAPWSEI